MIILASLIYAFILYYTAAGHKNSGFKNSSKNSESETLSIDKTLHGTLKIVKSTAGTKKRLVK